MVLFESFLGEIKLPDYRERFSKLPNGKDGGALIIFLNMLIRIFFIAAGLFAVWQFITAGWGFISASGDPKKLTEAQNKITLTMVGLLIMASSVVLAAIAGVLIFGKWDALLNPTLVGAPE